MRRIAREKNIDLTKVTGTGAGGRITKEDLEAFGKQAAAPAPAVSAPPAAPAPAAPVMPAVAIGQAQPTAKSRVEPMSNMRIKIAEHMVMQARIGACHDRAPRRYDARGKDAREAQRGFRGALWHVADLLPFVARATVEALRTYPLVNASIEGTNIIYHNEINLGIAVALENGLIVPVIRNADEKNVLGLQRSIVDLAARARARQLKPDEIQGGTFSITNFGTFGSVFATPVINQPQVAILGVGTIEKVPVVDRRRHRDTLAVFPRPDVRSPFDRRRAGRSVYREGQIGSGELVGRRSLAGFRYHSFTVAAQ